VVPLAEDSVFYGESIAYKYREGNVKRTLKRGLKVTECAKDEAKRVH